MNQYNQCHRCGKQNLQSVSLIDGLPTCSYCLPQAQTITPLIQDYSFILNCIMTELKEIKLALKEMNVEKLTQNKNP